MASPNISFDGIPSSIRKPGKYIEFNLKLAVRTLPANSQKVLLVGQRTAAGSILAGVIVDIFSDDEAAQYFGYGSQLHLMAIAGIKTYPYMALQGIALDDAAGSVAATGTITVTGPASSSGTLTVYIGNSLITVAIESGDTASGIAADIVASITDTPALPVTAAAVAGVITLTAKNKGTLGNQIKVSTLLSSASGVTAEVAAMANGLTDPDMTSALDAAYTAGHTIIGSAFNDSANLQVLRDHLDSISGPLEQRPATAAVGHTGTLSQSTTLAGAINSGRITIGLVPSTRSLSFEVAAAYAAVIASEEDPARPLNTLALKGIGIIPLANGLGRTEQENALRNGITPFEMGPGGKVQVVRAISTYTVNQEGISDIALLDITTVRTLDYVRKAIRDRWSLRFPREKLSERTPAKVRSENLDVLHKLEELEIVEEVDTNKDGLIVERDSQDPSRLNSKIPSDVVNGLHVMAGVIDLLL